MEFGWYNLSLNLIINQRKDEAAAYQMQKQLVA